MKIRYIWLVVITICTLFVSQPGYTKPLNVVASIRPIHSLVSAVMGETGTPYLIVSGRETPHMYAMKISDARALQAADIIFWVGANLESFLKKTIPSLNSEALAIPLSETKGISLLSVREGGVWEGHEHSGDDHDVDHDDDEFDMHIWLDPRNAIAMVLEIEQVLSAANPDQSDDYHRNAAVEIKKLETLDRNMAAQLSELQGEAFIQFHDAFQYLERQYSLHAVGAITLDPERQVGAERIRHIRERIIESDVVCLFTEPQMQRRLTEILTEGLEVKTMALDPVGLDFAPGPDLYFSLMERNLAALKLCLTNR